MIKEVRLSDSRINFKQEAEAMPVEALRADALKTQPDKFEKTKKDESPEEESKILPNTLGTRINQKYDKTMSAITEYPVKGFKGDVNSDFYEFLSMGIVPYVTGSVMFITMFNLLHKHLSPKAALLGKKMGLGVLFYGLAKTLSNDFVTRPVAWSTGVDIEMPYRNVYYPLPTKPGADAEIFPQHQQRKVYDSIEFFRKDLLAKDPRYGVKYYDKIAKKIGLGENLEDSVTETTPIIQSIVSATKTAKSLSSYAWAGVGVGLAAQNCWGDFFDGYTNRKKYVPKAEEGFFSKLGGRLKTAGKNTVDLASNFGKTFVKSCKTFWTGENGTKGYMKHAGKAWLIFTAALTALSTANVIYRAKHMGKLANKDLIDRSEESTVI